MNTYPRRRERKIPVGEVSSRLPALRVDHRIFGRVAEKVWRMSRNGIQWPVHGVIDEVTDRVEHKAQPSVRIVVRL